MPPLRTAILGCGRFTRRHAAHLAALDQVQLVGFCNRSIEPAQAFNHDYAGGQAEVFTNAEEMFDKLDLDLLYISLPPYAHDREVEWACQRGIHFLIEKPIALSMELAN